MSTIELNVDVDGAAIQGQVEQKASKVLYAFMQRVEQYAGQRVPVDTGRLKNSINLDPRIPGRKQYEVVAGTEYAGYVEYGTRKMQAQPYLRPAVLQARSEIKDIIRNVLS